MTEISHELSLELLKLEVRELEYIYIYQTYYIRKKIQVK